MFPSYSCWIPFASVVTSLPISHGINAVVGDNYSFSGSSPVHCYFSRPERRCNRVHEPGPANGSQHKKEAVMRKIAKQVVLLGCFFVVAVVVSSAQTVGLRVDIPFNFNVAEKVLPAGQYLILAPQGQTLKILGPNGAAALAMTNPSSGRQLLWASVLPIAVLDSAHADRTRDSEVPHRETTSSGEGAARRDHPEGDALSAVKGLPSPLNMDPS